MREDGTEKAKSELEQCRNRSCCILIKSVSSCLQIFCHPTYKYSHPPVRWSGEWSLMTLASRIGTGDIYTIWLQARIWSLSQEHGVPGLLPAMGVSSAPSKGASPPLFRRQPKGMAFGAGNCLKVKSANNPSIPSRRTQQLPTLRCPLLPAPGALQR